MKRARVAFLGLATFVSLTAQAAFDCSGAVLQALHYADGTVNIQTAWRNDFTVICNTNGTWNGVPGDVCFSWYATALKSVSDTKQLTIYYGATGYTCANMPTYWSALVPTYVGLKP